MSTLTIAIKNIKKNFTFYTLYIISISFIITIYFAFMLFSTNTIILEKISEDGRVESMCNTISLFLMIFVVFYMIYSNRFFLRRRTKELGIYGLLGYRKSTIFLLLTIENILVCICGLIIGIILGAVLHKLIIFGITELLKLNNLQVPLFNLRAIAKTICFILLVIFVLAISNGKFLFKSSIIDLVNFGKKAEKNLKFHLLPSLLGFIMTILGYILALDIFRGAKSIWISVGFYPIGMLTMLLVVIGTVFFISSFLPYIIQKSKNNKRKFYSEINIITTPNFIYRICSNSKTLIMLTLLSAATLTISSVMALTIYYPIAAVDRIAPSEIEFRIENDSQVEMIKQLVNYFILENDAVSFIQTDIYKVISSSSELPVEYSLGAVESSAVNGNILRESSFECISYSDYITLLKAQSKNDIIISLPNLIDNECILVKYQPNSDNSSEIGSTYPLVVGNNCIPVTVKETTLNNPISFANSIATLIVSDEVFNQIKLSEKPKISVMSINGKDIKDIEVIYREINKVLNDSPYLQGHSHRVNELFLSNSSTFLLIGFLVALFFIATCSILYFNNISAVLDTRFDYKILMKIGYTDMQIRKIIKKQVLIFYAIPFVLGLLDCIFATIVYKVALMQNLLGNTFSQYIPVIFTLVLTLIIYLAYYLLTIHTCYRAVYNMS